MSQLAESTCSIFLACVLEEINDVRLEAFKLVTGKLVESPFSTAALKRVREKWFALLSDPQDAAKVDDGQLFYLRALAQWLQKFGDEDAKWLVDESDSFASAVCLGVEKPLPRSPQVCPPKLKHMRLDNTEF